jgi:hypothetical protein
MKIERDTITFSSGRTAYANCGIIGLSPSLELSNGYDGGFNWPPEEWHTVKLTKEDMLELADYMIAHWRLFKAKIAEAAENEGNFDAK